MAAEVGEGGHDMCDLLGFEAVALLSGVFGILDVEAKEATCGQSGVQGCSIGADGPVEIPSLVGQGDDVQLPAVVLLAGKGADILVHASLAVEHGNDICGTLAQGERVQALEERAAAVGEAHSVEFGVADARCLCGLHDNGGQLLMVADEDEFADGWLAADLCREQWEELRLQHLRSLVDDGGVKCFQQEQLL